MIISDFTRPELDYFMAHCGFTDTETQIFKLRSHGASLQDIAVILELSIDTVKKTSQRINRKIINML